MKNRLLQIVEEKSSKQALELLQQNIAAEKEDEKQQEVFVRQIAKFSIGDTIDVHLRILEGAKSRTQVFNGVVIARRGEGIREMVTVRRLVQSEGVERVFPVNSPRIMKIEVKRTGVVRRAKLYYLRDRVGKATRLRERKSKETGHN